MKNRAVKYFLCNIAEHRGVAQPGLERRVRDAKVGGSNPLTPTTQQCSSGSLPEPIYLIHLSQGS